MTHPVIQVDRISKQYQLGLRAKSQQTFREAVVELAQAPFKRLRHLSGRSHVDDTFWALRDISFDVPEGEVLGIIGHNGAGKSTLLKILSRITEPTSGRAVVHGRVASLLEVGTGFHPELTGRENVYLNGAILGMSREEIRRKFDEIVEFAGVDKFLDTPIKRYSSGMKVRLAFAVAAHLEPEILIIDEVLAVGDQDFQNKCLGKMNEVAHSGRTVLFVSHNMAAVESLCNRCVLLSDGEIDTDGSPTAVISRYAKNYQQATSSWCRCATDDDASALRFESATLVITGVQPRQRVGLTITMTSLKNHAPAFVAADIRTPTHTIMQALPRLDGFLLSADREHSLSIDIELPPMIPATYSVTLWAGPHFTETYHEVPNCLSFEVVESPSPNRKFPHSLQHGAIVPHSTVRVESA